MINIFTSNTSNSANELVISEIGKNNSRDSYHIVFCPSNFGFSIERQIYEQLGLKGTFNIEITSFSRYSYKNLPSTLPTLTTEGGILITKKIILQNRDKLRHFKKMVDNVNFAGLMYKTVRQLRQNGYDSLFLKTRGEEIIGATGDKLKDIALIMEEFNREVSSKYIDNITRLELLADNIKRNEKLKTVHVYFIGFSYFSSQELGLVKAFDKSAISVNIGLVSAEGTPNEAYYQNRILNQLSNLEIDGIEMGKEVKSFEILTGTSQILHDEILGYRERSQVLPSNNNVVLFNESNVFEEINGVAHEIARLVRREGYRYKDINIVSCSPEYRNEISQIFARYDIPCFIDIKYPLAQSLSASYLLRAVEVARFNFSKDKVISLIKHPLFFIRENQSGTFSDDIFKYENFIYKNNINFRLFLEENKEEGREFEYIRKRVVEVVGKLTIKGSKVEKRDPKKKLFDREYGRGGESEISSLSLGEYLTEREEATLADLSLIDDGFLEDSSILEGGLLEDLKLDDNYKTRLSDRTISEYIKACREIVEETNEVLGNFLTMYRAEKYVKGEENVEELNVRANKTLNELFDVASETIGEERVKLQVFEQYLKTLISQQSIAMLPRYLDSVFVGDLLGSYIARPRAIFVIGASQDNLLSGVARGGILNNKDTAVMEKHLLSVYPSVKDAALIEGFMFIDLMSKYADKLYVGYSNNNLLGEPQKPSEAFLEIASILELKSISLSSKFSIDNAKTIEEIEDVTVSRANADFTFVSNKNRLLDAEKGKKLGKVLSVICNTLNREEENSSKPAKEKTAELQCKEGENNFTERDGCLGVHKHNSLEGKEPVVDKGVGLLEVEDDYAEEEKHYAHYFFKQDGEGNYMLSSSAIESYYTCPYAFFLQYGLKLKEREMGEIAPVDIGNIVHEVLDKYFKEYIKEQKDETPVSKNVYMEIAKATIEKVFKNIDKKEIYERDPQSVVKLENLRRECLDMLEDLTKNVQKGKYSPTFFERSFGMEGIKAVEIELEGGKKLLLRGRIDRIDTATIDGEKRAIVIDYKTGGRDKGAMKKIYLGREIQPFIYLMAIKSIDENIVPAGALYLVISDSLSKEGKKNKFSGQIVTDEKNIASLDTVAYEEAASNDSQKVLSSVLPFDIKMDKEGKIGPTSKLYPLKDVGKMEVMLDWVKGLISGAFKEIDAGCFHKMPFKDGCDFCYMKEACTKAKEEDWRKEITSTKAVDMFNLSEREKKLSVFTLTEVQDGKEE